MKKIGIVGGIAWPSTVEYYAGLCRMGEQRHRGESGGPCLPEMVIESLDHERAVAYVGNDEDAGSWLRFDAYHRDALLRLQAAGADFALIASNTSHHRLAEIVRGVRIPVLSIFGAVAAECARIGAGEVLILGTATIMRSARLREAFAARGIAAAGPADPKLRDECIMLSKELQHRGEVPGAAVRVDTIVRACCGPRFTVTPLVCLACTELPLAFPEFKALTVFESEGVRYMNSSAVHIRAIFDYATSG
ncbi:MAG TPA: aspartate/glutamate racemase family protein [Gammaproteobacteria bacterium]|nr:aspartate/glutamate racemase family protein [Gammaproteobacteria bacterium]